MIRHVWPIRQSFDAEGSWRSGTLYLVTMQNLTNDTFGPLVAYLLPGATVLVGIRPWVPVVDGWFTAISTDTPTLGGFIFLTVAALAAGMTVSAVRWAFVDTLHAWTGLCPPPLDFSRLAEKVTAYQLLIEIHYRHYQFYANMFVAVAVAWIGHRFATGWLGSLNPIDATVFVLEFVFFVTSRDTLRKYYVRLGQLLPARTTSSRACDPIGERNPIARPLRRPRASAIE